MVIYFTSTTLSAGTPTTLSAGTPTTLSAGTPTTLSADTPTTLSADTPTTLSAGTPTTLSAGTPTTLSADTPTTLSAGTPTTLSADTPTTLSAGASVRSLSEVEGTCKYTQVDKWIVSRLHQVTAVTSEAIDNYRFDLAAQAIYEFTWNEYCDWYLELSKISLQSDDEALQRGTRKTLLTVLEAILRLAHPIMPFITEEIWQRVAPLAGINGDTIMLQPYPVADPSQIDNNAISDTNWVMNFILGVRRIRGEMNIAPGKPLPILLQNGSEADQQNLANNRVYLQKLGRLESITWLSPDEATPESAIVLVGEMNILIPMAGLIDKEAELARLEKEIQKIHNDLPRVEGKLNNPAFVDKAPPDVIEKEKAKLADFRSMLNNLEQQQRKIQAL
jgi:valyl-tRNA synthetase